MFASQPPPPPPNYGGYQQPNYQPQPMPGYPPAMNYGPTNYAGIGARFLAMLMDGVIIGIPIGIISAVLSAMMAARVVTRAAGKTYNPGMAATDVGTVFAGFGFIMIISILLSWAYFAMMESSAWQGTIGKKIMGIQVTDVNGGRISLGRATIRLAVKAFLSGWFLIGYIMAFFTQRKQGLHDMIAGTLVLTKQAFPAPVAGYPPQYPPQQPAAGYGCPHCGAALPPGARFCSNCGKNL
jgi:uncharacterized RDD family membrane protein YckC